MSLTRSRNDPKLRVRARNGVLDAWSARVGDALLETTFGEGEVAVERSTPGRPCLRHPLNARIAPKDRPRSLRFDPRGAGRNEARRTFTLEIALDGLADAARPRSRARANASARDCAARPLLDILADRMRPQRNRRALSVLIALSAAFVVAAPRPSMAAMRSVALPCAGTGDDEIAARGGDTTLTWKDLDPVFLGRRAMSRDGRAALRHMAESRLLETSAKELGITVRDAAIDARWKELDQQIQSSGDKEGITGYLRRGRLTRESFLSYLRLAIVQETLTRRALALPDSAAITGEQQELWMDETLRDRGYVEVPPPWKDGVAARTSDFEIKLDEYVRYLRQRLPEEALREDCYQLLLERRMRARMPDLAPDKLERYVTDEIQRRREEANADPRYNGVPYERLISAQGILVDWLPKDPAVNVAALARLWVDRSYPAEALRRVYADEREHFDAQYGDALETYMIYLRAAGLVNEMNPRSFRDAEAQLSRWKSEIKTLDDFKRRAKESTEDAPTRESGGSLGFVTPGGSRVPAEVRAIVGEALRKDPPQPEGTLVGPTKLATGVVLLWLGRKNAGASWESMEKNVHRELRKRFVDEVLPKSGFTTYLELQ